jgi:hypothetical protein
MDRLTSQDHRPAQHWLIKGLHDYGLVPDLRRDGRSTPPARRRAAVQVSHRRAELPEARRRASSAAASAVASSG